MHDPLDRIVLRPLITPISTALVVGIVFSFSPMLGMLFWLVGLLVVIGWALATGIRAAVAAWRGMWRRSISLVAILICIWPIVGALALRGGDYIHLAVMWPFYKAQIDAVHGGATSFNWGLWGAFLVGVQRTLVYDPDDRAIETGARLGQINPLTSTSRHLVGHFYVIDDDA
jgi:hypothetical protein